VPCAYDYNVYFWIRRLDGAWQWVPTFKDRGFERRLKWISQCASIHAGLLHHLDYIKENTSRYFFEVYSIWAPKEYVWGWGMAPKTLDFHSCYFLGSYPNYWNVENKRVVFAHDLMTSEAYSMEKTPTIPGAILAQQEIDELNALEKTYGKENLMDYLYPERIPKDAERLKSETWQKTQAEIDKAIEDLSFFFTKFDITNYLLQKEPLDLRQKRFKECDTRNYPKPRRPYTPKPISPEAPEPATTTPMDQVTKPSPSGDPCRFKMVGQKCLHIETSFGFKPGTPENILQLIMTLKEAI